MNKSEKGFAVLEVLAVLVTVAIIIGLAGWYVRAHQKGRPAASDQSQTSQKQDSSNDKKPEAWLTYKNEEAGLTFQYPENWESTAKETFRYDDGAFGGVGGTLTSQQGNELTWVYQVAGGKGGECKPNPGDVPFTSGNNCASKQIVSIEKISSVVPKTTSFRNLFEDNLFITRTKYMPSGASDKISYQICLDPFSEDEPPEVGTRMNLLFPCEFWDTGFNVKFEVKDEAAFNSPDAKTAERIMKSFNSL
jgi:hypothetical protein